LRGQPFDKLFLVTSGLHLRRALLYFGHFGVYPTPCAADRITPLLSILPLVQLRHCRLRGPRIRRDRAVLRLQLAWLEPIWDSFWIPLNFSLFSPRDHRVGTMRVVFLAWTPGRRWPERAYLEDVGRGGSSGSTRSGEPVKSRRASGWERGHRPLGSPAVFPVSSCRASRETQPPPAILPFPCHSTPQSPAHAAVAKPETDIAGT
jgi:hypothetical protein